MDDEYTTKSPKKAERVEFLIPVEVKENNDSIKFCSVCKDVIPNRKDKFIRKKIQGKLHKQNPSMEFPDCGCVVHFNCIKHTRWECRNGDTKEDFVLCPSCTEPTPKFTLQQFRDFMASKYPPNTTGKVLTEEEQVKLSQKLIEALARTRNYKDAFLYSTRINNDYSKVWEFVKSGELNVSDFLKLGWDMSEIYHYITKDFYVLCNKYGFDITHLKDDQTAIGLAVNYKVTDRDLKIAFPNTFNLKTLIGLRMHPSCMATLGINAHKLCVMGMKKDGIKQFDWITMRQWIKTLDFGRNHLIILGIRHKDFYNPKVLGMKQKIRSDIPFSDDESGALWTIKGLKELLAMTDQELVEFQLAPHRTKRGGFAFGKQKGPYRMRKSLKERSMKRSSSPRTSEQDSPEFFDSDTKKIINNLKDQNVFIVVPMRKKKNKNLKKKILFAPITEEEKDMARGLEKVKKMMS